MSKAWPAWLHLDRTILRGALVLGSGAVVGQLVMLLATPAIARLYNPGQLGLFALYLSFVNIAVTIAPLGFQRALPSTSDRHEASQLASGILWLQPLMGCTLSAVFLLMIRNRLFGFETLPSYAVALTGFSILANTLLITLRFWFIREESYPIIGRVQVLQNIGRAVLQIILGLGGAGLFGLITGDFTGRLLGLGGMLRRAWPDLRPRLWPPQFRQKLPVFRKYHRFLFPQLPSIVINTVARMLPIPLLVQHLGPEAAGLYAVVDRILQVPVALISKSFGDALHGRIGRLALSDPRRITSVFLKSAVGLFAAGVLPTLCVVYRGEQLMALVLGPGWDGAGTIAQMIAPLALATLVVSTSSRIVYVFQAFYTELLYNLLSLAIVISVFWNASRQDWELMQTVSWLARLSIAGYAIYFLLLIVIVRRGVTTAARRSVVADPGDSADQS